MGKGKGHSSSSHHHHQTSGKTSSQTSPLAPTTSPNTTNTNPPGRTTPVGFSASNSIPGGTQCNGQTITLFTFATPFRNVVAAQFTVPGRGTGPMVCPVSFTINFLNMTSQTVSNLAPGSSTIIAVPANAGVTSVTATCSNTNGAFCGGTATLFFTERV